MLGLPGFARRSSEGEIAVDSASLISGALTGAWTIESAMLVDAEAGVIDARIAGNTSFE